MPKTQALSAVKWRRVDLQSEEGCPGEAGDLGLVVVPDRVSDCSARYGGSCGDSKDPKRYRHIAADREAYLGPKGLL